MEEIISNKKVMGGVCCGPGRVSLKLPAVLEKITYVSSQMRLLKISTTKYFLKIVLLQYGGL